jgi:putative membrane protein insertion efficiency factor
MKIVRAIFSTLLLAPVYFYKGAISPHLSPSCRHTPSCSTYAIDAIKKHGPLLGLAMGTNRILRCRPGGTWGYDPVPLIWIKRYKPFRSWTGVWRKCNRLKYDTVRN